MLFVKWYGRKRGGDRGEDVGRVLGGGREERRRLQCSINVSLAELATHKST